jgi:SagB-type dehydrogenase family enzyme
MLKIIQENLHFTSKKEEKPYPISELYNENIKLYPSTIHAVLPSAKFSDTEILAMKKGYKQYPHAKRIELPSPKEMMGDSRTFNDVVTSRKSVKNFGEEAISLPELSKILWLSYGTTGKVDELGVGNRMQRVVPSAGGLYPAEIYLGIRNVIGLGQGIYHYNVPNHELELLSSGDPTEQLSKVCCDQSYAREAGVVLLISAVLARTKSKYGERGYRYAILDIGHLGQNIYLSCTALCLAVMTTCGFFDDIGNSLLKLDGLDESLMYVAFIGKKNES